MTKQELNKIFEDGRDRRKNFFAVRIETEGHPAPEIIINPVENLNMKQAYYNKAYDDDLVLISAKERGKLIRITDALATNNLNDLSWFAY
jgi:hypothetical protein